MTDGYTIEKGELKPKPTTETLVPYLRLLSSALTLHRQNSYTNSVFIALKCTWGKSIDYCMRIFSKNGREHFHLTFNLTFVFKLRLAVTRK